jgi:hypothetical protein
VEWIRASLLRCLQVKFGGEKFGAEFWVASGPAPTLYPCAGRCASPSDADFGRRAREKSLAARAAGQTTGPLQRSPRAVRRPPPRVCLASLFRALFVPPREHARVRSREQSPDGRKQEPHASDTRPHVACALSLSSQRPSPVDLRRSPQCSLAPTLSGSVSLPLLTTTSPSGSRPRRTCSPPWPRACSRWLRPSPSARGR